ncbi:hypothetical protein MBLNU459_g2159t1 [Dothideomycetes sp. NU459]
MQAFFASLLLFPALSRTASATTTSSSTTACNNSPDLCDKAYNNITYLGAHDSPFLRDLSTDYSESGNQFYNSSIQLSAGVRLLTAQVHNNNGSWDLCHSSCDLLNAGTLTSWLSEIKTWLDSNPNEVVTLLLVNSDDATAADLAAQYSAADIEKYAYSPDFSSAPSTWPTLQTLINNGTRLLNFVADVTADSSYPYLMNEFTYIFENNYDNSSPSNFSCTANRPSSVDGDTATALSQNLMPLMNHFLYADELLGIEVPDVSAINVTNAPSGGAGNLGDAAAECAATYSKPPTYLLVDFFNVGPAIETADSLNGVTNAVGRTDVSSALLVSSSSGASANGRNLGALLVTFLAFVVLVV